MQGAVGFLQFPFNYKFTRESSIDFLSVKI